MQGSLSLRMIKGEVMEEDPLHEAGYSDNAYGMG